jgi:hypothetical protein
MKQLKEEIQILINSYTGSMEAQAKVKAFSKAAELQVKIGTLDHVLLMMRNIKEVNDGN